MADIKEYLKGTPIKLTLNFTSTEFDCNCKYPECTKTLIDLDHVKKIQALHDCKWPGKAMKINSGYRCPKRNADEGGATKSRHLFGDAVDLVVAGVSADQVADDCEDFNGLGRYVGRTHLDSRPAGKARWDYRLRGK